MWNHLRLSSLVVALALLGAAPAMADYQAAYDAYDAKDYQKAYDEIRPLAEKGEAKAQSLLGDLYYNGKGVAQDYAEAVRWYRRAAEQGYADAEYSLGYAYAHGEGVTKDMAQAVGWYKAAADHGDSRAPGELGELYMDGAGVPQDYAEARRLLQISADAGVPWAMVDLGDIYAQGLGVEGNDAEAFRWYKAAADLNNVDGVFAVAMGYENGYGVPKNIEEAKRWYQKAAAQGDAESKKALERLGGAPGSMPAASKSTADATGADAPDDCSRIVGNWSWFIGGVVGAAPDGGLIWRQTADGASTPAGRWQCEAGGSYTLTWNNGFVDRLQLSSDGRRLVGTNQQGTSVSGQRVQ